jgi:GH15 family glucan-1,4-alpha-glucosidase
VPCEHAERHDRRVLGRSDSAAIEAPCVLALAPPSAPDRRSVILKRVPDLARRSVEIIREHQSTSGAFPASPAFPAYRFCWLRDGSFIADAISAAGERESAEAFFGWCARVVEARRDRLAAGERLHARYRLDGRDDESEWPRLQHDGYGLWLWALDRHAERHGADVSYLEPAAELTADYLERVWREPCVDWWEERDGVHAATLGSIAVGLARRRPDTVAEARAAAHEAAPRERFDASHLVLVPPFGNWDADVAGRVRTELLSPGGGVYRYRGDTYYGGGEWLLLTAMLGLAEAARGETGSARERLAWIAARATPEGDLPEQAQDQLQAPEHFGAWVERWGPPASPLLWSHAMYLLLVALDAAA